MLLLLPATEHRSVRSAARCVSLLAVLCHVKSGFSDGFLWALRATVLEGVAALVTGSDEGGGQMSLSLLLSSVCLGLMSAMSVALHPVPVVGHLWSLSLACATLALTADSWRSDRRATRAERRRVFEDQVYSDIPGWKRDYGAYVMDGDARRAKAIRDWELEHVLDGPSGWSEDYGPAISEAEGDRRRKKALENWRRR